ncbi:hypothetical protein [Streptomyces sp. NPDC001507]|uniref:hypothetical protein n=1 Tax=Streptomyces sp. NPDC001507 TaxID=3364579 RepID=UPI0036862C97
MSPAPGFGEGALGRGAEPGEGGVGLLLPADVSLALRASEQSFAKTVSKAIPLVGAAVSGVTFATYLPMAKRLRKHLSSLPLADPSHRAWDGEVVDGEVVEVVEDQGSFATAHAEHHGANDTADEPEKPHSS